MFRTTLDLENLDPRIAPAQLGQANFGNLISALNNVAVQVDRVNVLQDVGEIRVVNIEDSLNDLTVNVNALNNALNNRVAAQ